MIIVSMNIAGTRVLNNFPILFEFENVREWTDFIREDGSMLAFLDWSHTSSVSVQNMRLFIRIDEGDLYWEFIINLKNVREFKKYLTIDWKEKESIVEAWRREKKINDIIE